MLVIVLVIVFTALLLLVAVFVFVFVDVFVLVEVFDGITVNQRFIPELFETFEIFGAVNGGITSPPYNIETVPVGEIEITFAFAGVIFVAAVHTPLQIVNNGETGAPFASVVI